MKQAVNRGRYVVAVEPETVTAPEQLKTCQVCEWAKPLDDFSVRRASKDGKQSHCRDCQRRANFDNRARWKRARKNVPARKACPRCHTTKPAAEFSVMNAARTGLQPWCKACQADHRNTHKGPAT